jgi:cell division protein FtsB
MPQARSAASAARKARAPRSTPLRPRRVPAKPPLARVRWDRVGRVGLLVVLVVVGGLYLQHTLELLSSHARAQREVQIVRNLVKQNAALTREEQSLNDPATIQSEARALGMVHAGERPYVVTPGH